MARLITDLKTVIALNLRKRPAMNLKTALFHKNFYYYDRVVHFARYFKLATKRDLANTEAQRTVFGRVLGDPNSVEIQAVMLIFLREHFGDSYQVHFLTKEDKDKFTKAGENIGLGLLSKYYAGEKNNVLQKMRTLRTVTYFLFLLITLGLVVLFSLHLANKMPAVCAIPNDAAQKITLIVAIGIAALLGMALFIWETVKPRDFEDYKSNERSKEQLLDKLSPHVMRNPYTLYAFSCVTIVLMIRLCSVGETLGPEKPLMAEFAFAVTLAVLAASSLCVMAAAYCSSTITPFSGRPAVSTHLYDCSPNNLKGLPENGTIITW